MLAEPRMLPAPLRMSRMSVRGRSRGSVSRPSAVLGVLAVAAVAVLGLLRFGLAPEAARGGGYDEHLCPADPDGARGLTVLLLDLTKPLDGLPRGLPGQLFRDLTDGLERDAEVRTFLLGGLPSAPRTFVHRLCKPFDDDDLAVATAKDAGGAAGDCDNLPAQLPPALRGSATAFCNRRDAAAARLGVLMERAAGDRSVHGAYLMEALDETRREFAARPGPHRLHMVSDMLQHADWYSHLELPVRAWTYATFKRRRDAGQRLLSRWEGDGNVSVDIHYVPRIGLTTDFEAASAHRRFWREFFNDGDVTFHGLPPLPPYEAASWGRPIDDPRDPAATGRKAN